MPTPRHRIASHHERYGIDIKIEAASSKGDTDQFLPSLQREARIVTFDESVEPSSQVEVFIQAEYAMRQVVLLTEPTDEVRENVTQKLGQPLPYIAVGTAITASLAHHPPKERRDSDTMPLSG